MNEPLKLTIVTFEDVMEHFSDYHYMSGDNVYTCEEAAMRFARTFAGVRVYRQTITYICMRRAKRK